MLSCSFLFSCALLLLALCSLAESIVESNGSTVLLVALPGPNNSWAKVPSDTPLQGWTSRPDGRGSLDILWSCLFTSFLCSWSVLCLNVPARDDSLFRCFRRKIYLMALGFVGPEFLLMLAQGQYQSARRSVKEFKDSGYDSWSMTHAFFADMGGFLLQPPSGPALPLDAKQVHWLVEKGYLPYPTTKTEEITDKNKSDGFVRILTVGQTLWFVIDVCGRAAQHLAITTFELTVLGFIACTLPTVYYWARKPSDVETAITLAIDTEVDDIRYQAGVRGPYSLTPLDFISYKPWNWNLYWAYWFDILKHFHIVFGVKVRPVNRRPNDLFPELTRLDLLVLFIFNSFFAGINMAAWHFHFPTRTEAILWRISTVLIPACLFAFWAWDETVWNLIPKFKKCLRWKGAKEKGRLHRWISDSHQSMVRFRNAGIPRDPTLDVPVRAIWPLTFIAFWYLIARAYILLEDLLTLRALPPSAYNTVSWSDFLPHI